MFKLVESHLKKIGKDGLLPAGIILTGGGSSVQTVSDIAKAVLRLPSQTAALSKSAGSKVQMRDGSWAVAYGLTIWGFTQGNGLEAPSQSGIHDITYIFWRFIKKLLP